MQTLYWHPVTGFTPNGSAPIGAIGFLGDDAVCVVSFFDDRDGNKDGKVSVGERLASMLSPLSLKNSAVVEVAMNARFDMDVLSRDPSFNQMAMKMYLNFARGLIVDGIYATYFGRGVKIGAGQLAVTLTSDRIKQIVIRKGFEKAVETAFKEAMK